MHAPLRLAGLAVASYRGTACIGAALKAGAKQANFWCGMREWTTPDVQAHAVPGVQEEPEGILRPRKLLGRDKNEAPQGITDLLPEWMGYGALYAVSAAPIVIGVGVVVILFVNSLK